jgi:hypothetical protein
MKPLGRRKENPMSQHEEVRLVQELRKRALEIRTLAYALPTGSPAQEILQLANRLIAAADRLAVRKAAERLIPTDEVAT